MKLVNFSKKEDAYVAKAITSVKIFGISLSSTTQQFVKPLSEETWYDFKGHEVSENKQILLDKWLRDHQRFLE
ncbi:hypothetical protein [Gramella sp. KN1008]|uniref:hypothetical protein n=1 Tax=Gramella sp. KN1008 TaxID=2529298 RepID=UPI001039ABBD|nr:hypothetical protein [Gramella sp. KN1008]TBW26401.1 hypothetical protein EZJ28_14450 [Gramella sp. KN1008]